MSESMYKEENINISYIKHKKKKYTVFFHNRPKALAQFDPKSNVLHINGKG